MKPRHPASNKFVESGLYNDLSSFAELDERIRGLPETERGDAFEVFAEAYLATQRISQAKNIWPSLKLPPRLVNQFNLGKRKTVGLDGVIETTTGKWHAYEVKFRTSRNLIWDNISSFFGRTEMFDQRIVFTNCNRLAAEIQSQKPNQESLRARDGPPYPGIADNTKDTANSSKPP